MKGRGSRQREPEVRINQRIRAREVRLVAEDGEQLGVVQTREALKMSEERGVDLVEVAPQARPPVCRIMDYGKFKYDKGKKSQKSKSHQTKLKETRY